MVVRDSAELAESEAAAWAALSVRAGLSAPNLRGGVCVAALGVTSVTPRDWTDEEIALVEETADRTWAFVERCRAEAELRESEELFRTLADAAPALIWHIDAAGVSRFVNQRYLDFTGRSLEETASWLGLVHPDDAASHAAALQSGAAEHRAWRARARVRRHDGVYRELETHAAPLFDDDGTYVGQVGISFDVSEPDPTSTRIDIGRRREVHRGF